MQSEMAAFIVFVHYLYIKILTMIYLKKFENHAAYDAAKNNLILPNVSLCVEENDVHYNPYVPKETRVVGKFNVKDVNSYTKIAENTTSFTSVEIDGIEQPSVVTNYTFNTIGEHVVKYTLASATTIGNRTFYDCSGLTSIDMPDSVIVIGYDSFQYCGGLTSCTMGSGVTSIGDYAFYNCSGLTSIDMPDSLGLIGEHAFGGCKGLTNVNIPNKVTSIGRNAFSYCTNLSSCTISNSIKTINTQTFLRCYSLVSIDIPSGVTSIGSSAFGECSGLTMITSNAVTAPTIHSSTFRDVKSNGTLYVPIGSSGYDLWMSTGDYYLGLYNWTKVEQ